MLKTMKKRPFISIVALIPLIAVMITGCGKNVATSEKPADTKNTRSETETSTGAPADPAAAKNEADHDLKFAVVFDLGGIGDNGKIRNQF